MNLMTTVNNHHSTSLFNLGAEKFLFNSIRTQKLLVVLSKLFGKNGKLKVEPNSKLVKNGGKTAICLQYVGGSSIDLILLHNWGSKSIESENCIGNDKWVT